MKRPLDAVTVGRLRFRLLEERDLPLTLCWRNKERVRSMLFHTDPLTMDVHRAWFTAYRELDDDFVFLAEASAPFNAPIGQASLYNVEWEAGRAEFGRFLVGEDEALGQGFGTAIVGGVAEIGLRVLGLNELYSRIKAENTPSIRAHQSAGFTIGNQGEDPLLLHLHRSNLR